MTDSELTRARKQQTIINAYARVFATAEGKTVLADLEESFGMDRPAFLPLEGKPVVYDTHYAAMRDGQRSVRLHIAARLASPVKGDGNIVKAKRKVKKVASDG